MEEAGDRVGIGMYIKYRDIAFHIEKCHKPTCKNMKLTLASIFTGKD